MDRLKNESGQALLLVMMVLMVLMLVGAASLTRASSSHMRSFEQMKMVQSSYIAEAGVEKVLAYIKNDYKWLKELPYNVETVYAFEGNDSIKGTEDDLTTLDYAGGTIDVVKITRTSADGENPTEFYIESRGTYLDATRTIKVTGEMYDPIDFNKGVWVQSSSVFSNNTVYYCNVTGQGDLTFSNNSYASGDILAGGSITLENNVNANSIFAGQDVEILNNVIVTSLVKAGRDVIINNNGEVKGKVNAIRNVSLENNAKITGDVYYNGSISLGSNAVTGPRHPGGAAPVTVDIPSFPVLDESIYMQYPNPAPSGTLYGSFNIDGIYYVPGNLNISGTYYGNGMIVTHGKITITGDLIRGNKQSSLALIALGNNNGVGISGSNNATVYALLYSPYEIVLNNNYIFYGSLICNSVQVNNNTVVTYDDTLQINHPKWMTTVIKIKSWKEAFPVF